MALMELLLPFGVRCSPALAVLSLSHVRLCDSMNARLPCPSHQLPELAQTHVCWVGDAIQPSHPLSPLPLLLSIFPSFRVFSKESVLYVRWPKYWSFSISPSNEYSGLISFGIDWFDLLAVQGTLKNLLQHHSSKASVLQCSAFFIVQLPHPYMTTGKTIALTRWTFVGKVMPYLHPYLFALYSLRPLSDLENHRYCFFKYFLIWTIFKVFIEFVKYCFNFMFCFLTLRHVGS